MSKKISLPVLVTVMCLMVTVVVGFFWLNQQRIKTKVVQKPATATTRTDYSGVARKTLDWIDKQRNDEGWYILERGCNFDQKTCETVWDNPEGNQDGLIATWARFNFYQQTKDQKDLEIVKNDLNIFFDKYPQGVSNALWICKITYDMYSSNLFDEEINNKLKDICFKSSSNFPEVFSNQEDYGRNLTGQLNDGRQVSPVWGTWQGYSFVVRGFDPYFGLASDVLSQYLWTKDNSKLELAKQYFESGKRIIEEKDVSSIRAEDDCLLGLSAIDLYQFGDNDETYLNYARERYLTFSDDTSDVKKYRTTICGLMTKKLYQLDKNQIFLSGLEKNNQVLTGNLLDGENSFVKLINDYGFFITNYGGINSPFKDIVENGLTMELLRD